MEYDIEIVVWASVTAGYTMGILAWMLDEWLGKRRGERLSRRCR